MKIRTMFVTNSSSSSYICEICDRIDGGWDSSPTDLGFVQCECGHIICEHHAYGEKEIITQIKNLSEYDKESFSEIMKNFHNKFSHKKIENILNDSKQLINLVIYENINNIFDIPAVLCPICSLDYPDYDITSHFISKFSLQNYNDFNTRLKQINPNTTRISEKYIENYLITNNLTMETFLKSLKQEYGFSYKLPHK